MTLTSRKLGIGGLVVSPQGLGCMGMSEFYGPGDETESVATIHRALDLGVTLPRHRRHVRALRQRGAGRTGHRRPAGRGGAGHQVRDRPRPRLRPTGRSGATRPTSRRPARRRSAGWVSTISTSTTSTAATPASPSRRRSGPWPSWWPRARCGTSGCPRRARHPPPGLRRAPHRRPPERVVAVEPRHRGRRGAPRPASSGSASWPTAHSGGDSSPARSPRPTTSPSGDFRAPPPRFSGENFDRNIELVDGVRSTGRRQGLHAGPAGPGLGPRPGRRRGAHPRHQAAHLPRGEHRPPSRSSLDRRRPGGHRGGVPRRRRLPATATPT